MVGPMAKENKKTLKTFPKGFNGKSVLWFTYLPYFPWDFTVILCKLCIGFIINLQVNFSLIYVNYARKVRRIGFTNVLAEKRHSWFYRICTKNSDEVRILSKIMSTKIVILEIFEMFSNSACYYLFPVNLKTLHLHLISSYMHDVILCQFYVQIFWKTTR